MADKTKPYHKLCWSQKRRCTGGAFARPRKRRLKLVTPLQKRAQTKEDGIE